MLKRITLHSFVCRITCAVVLQLCLSSSAICQLFPGLQGEELADALRNAYTPETLLDDTQVKDTLYAKIFIEGDTVKCIYSGLARFLPENVDPSQFLFGSGNETQSINMEHGWPQAKGASDGTNGNMDMHHLYPSRVEINSDRGNFPFMEINDNATQKWYYLAQEMSTKPAFNIDAYSEFLSGSFEPRESVKGDIARAMFYFWTIYRNDAEAADPDFFNLQVANLCAWHQQDPVDEFEMLRNDRIAEYQGDKKNPFILDCSLAKRAYCSQLAECIPVAVAENRKSDDAILFDTSLKRFGLSADSNTSWNLLVINLLGQPVHQDLIIPGEWGRTVQFESGFYVAIAFNGIQLIHTKIYIP